MQNTWIDIKKMPIPTGYKGLRILVYTPSEDPVMRYRNMTAEDAVRRACEVTHWQPLLDPK